MVIGTIAAIAAVLSVVLCLCTGGFGSLVWLWLLPLGWLGAFVGILLLLFLMVLVMCAFVVIEKEETEDNPLYRRVIYMIADAAHTVLQVRVKSEGVEKIPNQGRVLLVCNHLHNADPVILFHQV